MYLYGMRVQSRETEDMEERIKRLLSTEKDIGTLENFLNVEPNVIPEGSYKGKLYRKQKIEQGTKGKWSLCTDEIVELIVESGRGTKKTMLDKHPDIVFQEVCWLIEDVEHSIINKCKPKKYEYYFLGENPEGKTIKIIKACISKITENVKQMKEAFESGNRIPSEYYNILVKLGDKELTEKNVLDVVYSKVATTKSSYANRIQEAGRTNRLRKQIQCVIATNFGFKKNSVFIKKLIGDKKTIRQRIQGVARYPEFRDEVCEGTFKRNQKIKNHWVFGMVCPYAEGVDKAPAKVAREMIKCIYTLVAENMDCLENLGYQPEARVVFDHDKLRVENEAFPKAFLNILIYILLRRYTEECKPFEKIIRKYDDKVVYNRLQGFLSEYSDEIFVYGVEHYNS